MTDEEKREYEELKSLLYTGTISQYGKRKLIDIIEKQSKEIEELTAKNKKHPIRFTDKQYNDAIRLAQKVEASKWEDKIKAEIKELQNMKVDGEAFTTAVNFAIKEMQSLLEKE